MMPRLSPMYVMPVVATVACCSVMVVPGASISLVVTHHFIRRHEKKNYPSNGFVNDVLTLRLMDMARNKHAVFGHS